MKLLEQEPVTPKESEKRSINLLVEAFRKENPDKPILRGPSGFEIELPDSVFQALVQVVNLMMRGQAVSIIPATKEVTTQEAADFLNVSRPYLVKLLEQCEIPYTLVGTHRRIRFSDLLLYKKDRDAKRMEGLSKIAAISEEEGMYD